MTEADERWQLVEDTCDQVIEFMTEHVSSNGLTPSELLFSLAMALDTMTSIAISNQMVPPDYKERLIEVISDSPGLDEEKWIQ